MNINNKNIFHKVLLGAIGPVLGTIYFFLAIVAQQTFQKESKMSMSVLVLYIIILGAIVMGVLIMIYNKLGSKTPKILMLNDQRIINYVGIGWGVVLVLLSVLLVGLIHYFMYPDIDASLLVYIFNSPASWLLVMIVPAVSEEIIFRVCILHSFHIFNKGKAGIIISGVGFGLIHILNIYKEPFSVTNMIWVVNLIISGFWLGYLYLRYGLIVVIFFHWLWNATWYRNMSFIERSISVPIVFVALFIASEYVLKRYHFFNKKKVT